MSNTEIKFPKLGSDVTDITRQHAHGGQVIDIDKDNQRVRVAWKRSATSFRRIRTWVQLSRLNWFNELGYDRFNRHPDFD